MDSGTAVVVGALIALAGSSLIPWLRERLSARTLQKRARQERLRESVIDLLAANAAQAAALDMINAPELHVALEARARATARLLVDVDVDERIAMTELLNISSPKAPQGGTQSRALQFVLASWYAGDLDAANAPTAYLAEMLRLSGTPKDDPIKSAHA